MVLASANELPQLFVNLLINARDAVDGRAAKQVPISVRAPKIQ